MHCSQIFESNQIPKTLLVELINILSKFLVLQIFLSIGKTTYFLIHPEFNWNYENKGQRDEILQFFLTLFNQN